MSDFVHLHLHSQFSLLDGANRIGDLIGACQADGQRALALTDNGNMFGAIELYQSCAKAGIRPIVGCEVYIARRSRFEPQRARCCRKLVRFVMAIMGAPDASAAMS